MKKIDLITGFLGSGKTTFINEYADYLVRHEEKVAIIVNDYGAINVDRLLLEETLGDKCHLEMVIGGDPDCTRRRMKTKLISMAMAGYSRVIVEPSGVFEAEEFFDMIYEEPLDRWYDMGSVITVMDAGLVCKSYGPESEKEGLSVPARYLIASQVSKAGTVVLSKSDALSNPSEDNQLNKEPEVEGAVRFINSCLEEFKCNRKVKDVFVWKLGEVTDEEFKKVASSGYHSGEMVKLPVEEMNGFKSLFFFHVKTDVSRLEETIGNIFSDEKVGNLIRLKGFIRDVREESDGSTGYDKWLEVNATKDMISIKPIAVGQELFILIGESLDQERIGNYWEDYRNSL
jgi:G3E family GTPase